MTKRILLIGMIGVVVVPLRPGPQPKNDDRAVVQQRAINVSISAGGGRNFGPVREFFRVGDPITIVVFMTNTGIGTTYAEIADPYYQNRPKLTKENEEIPYRQKVIDVLKWKDEQGCGAGRMFPVELKPNEKTEVDFLIVSEGPQQTANVVWYDELGPGKYGLIIRRRFGCSPGPETESNAIHFEVGR